MPPDLFHGRTAEPEAIRPIANVAVPLLVAIALALRLNYYLLNPSLSNDEASLALNLMHRSYAGLFERLDFDQAAPPGFLLLQKLVISLLGPSSYSLRLVPLVTGAAACLLVYPLTTRLAGRIAGMVALALFAVSDPLLTYAVTDKQYSVDVAVALALCALTVSIRDRLGTRETASLGSLGIIAAFFSHPAAFVLAGIWIVLLVENVVNRRGRSVAWLATLGIIWLCSLATAYLVTRRSIEQIQASTGLGWGGPHEAARTLGGIARYLLGIPAFAPEVRAAITCVAVAVCLIGIKASLRTSVGLTAVLVVPPVIALTAASMGLYLEFPRAFLFVIPSSVVLIGIGTEFLVSRRQPQIVRAISCVAIVILAAASAFQTAELFRPSVVTERTRVFAYLAEHARSDDSLYVSRTAQYTFRYYLECGCFANSAAVEKARAMWPIEPTAGYGQFDAALQSSPPSLAAGNSLYFSEEELRNEFAPLLTRGRVWVLLVDPYPTAKRALTLFLRKQGRLFEPLVNKSDAATSLFLYTPRRHE